jgi:bla regulator protein blaR1
MIGWAVETLVATTLVMLLVLGLRAPVRRHFGAHMAYALWLLPVARLLLPPLPGQWQLTRLLSPAVREAEQAHGVVVGIMNPATLPPEATHSALIEQVSLGGHPGAVALVPPTAVANGPSLLLLMLGLWLAGAALFLAYHLVAHRRYTANLLRRARQDRTVAEGKVRVIETDAAHGPLAFGIFRKYVAFPRDFAERYDAQERDLALAHELGHHIRGDLVANWVALVVLALHWFNPVAWRAFRAFRADQEMACDALVLAGRAQALRHAYGRAIVKSAHGGAVSAACHLHTINDVKGRLRMLSQTRKNSPKRIAAGLAGTTALGLAALGLTASGTQAAERMKHRVEAATGVSLDQPLPVMPAMPVMPVMAEKPVVPIAPVAPIQAARPAKPIKKVIVVHTDGSRQVTEMPAMPDMKELGANLPEIRDGKCGSGSGTVIHRQEGAKKVMIICSDRIADMSANAEKMAMQSKMFGMASARMSLRMARTTIENERNLSASQRAEALKGLDKAEAELAKEGDKD